MAGSDFTNPFEYNPATNAWTTKPSTLPDGQVNNMACGVLTVSGTDQIYCVGGSQATIVGNASRVFSYNPATDTFTTLAAGDNWPGSQAGAFLPGGFAVAGNKLYIIGSFNANSVPPVVTNQVWQFDPTAAVGSKWLARANYPVARAYVPAASIGGFIYTAGGSNLDAGGLLIDTTDSFKYDPVADAWRAIASIPRATGETRAVVMNGKMWVLGGGRVAPNPGSEVDIYDPVANTWSVGLPFDALGRRNFPADSDGTSHIFMAGGYDNAATQVNTMRIFGPGPCVSPSPTPSPSITPIIPTPTPTPATPTPTPATPTPTITPPTDTPTPTPPTTPSPTPGVSPPAQAVNFSTRMHVEGGDKVGIGGFIVSGVVPKRVIVRAIGPSLTRYGLIDVLADPVLELHGPTGFVTIINDNWRDTQEAEIQATGLPPTNNLESAIVATWRPETTRRSCEPTAPRRWPARVWPWWKSTTSPRIWANWATSARAFVGTGDNIVIAGFILGNNGGDDNVIVRGMGPSLRRRACPIRWPIQRCSCATPTERSSPRITTGRITRPRPRLLVRRVWRRATTSSRPSRRHCRRVSTPRCSPDSTTAPASAWWKFTTAGMEAADADLHRHLESHPCLHRRQPREFRPRRRQHRRRLRHHHRRRLRRVRRPARRTSME